MPEDTDIRGSSAHHQVTWGSEEVGLGMRRDAAEMILSVMVALSSVPRSPG